jgi:hypothetical protein
MILADAVLALHVGIILFNVFGLVVIPLGGWLGWRFVRVAWWRLLHLGAMAVVAMQALVGQACFLTLWQDALVGMGQGEPRSSNRGGGLGEISNLLPARTLLTHMLSQRVNKGTFAIGARHAVRSEFVLN